MGKQLNMWLEKVGQLYEEGKDVINSMMVYPGEEKLHTRAVEVLLEMRDIAVHEIPQSNVWVPVKERLPECSGGNAVQVIVCSWPEDKEPLSICAVFYRGIFYLQEKWDIMQLNAPVLKYTTHWAPLLEPPHKKP